MPIVSLGKFVSRENKVIPRRSFSYILDVVSFLQILSFYLIVVCRRIPRTIECELFRDQVDTCVPGDVVSVCGEIKVLNSEDNGRGRSEKASFLLYLSANCLTNKHEKMTSSDDDDKRYMAGINEIHVCLC